ncbi:uncharacterized protein YegP (UPF0339 family) [Arthrobacter sp. UYNi723]
MTGTFELFTDEETLFRFRLKAPDGTVVAVSRSFPDKAAAVAGIAAVREYAGMGMITDQCPDIPRPRITHSVLGGPATFPRSGRPAEAPQRTAATGSYRPAAPGRVPVGCGLHRAA